MAKTSISCFNIMYLSKLHILLVLLHAQSVFSCIRLYSRCCPNYVPYQLPENARFQDPKVFYTKPEITDSSDCKKMTVDCTHPDVQSEFYNLVLTDKDENVSRVIQSSIPVFELNCDTNATTLVSCEQGCDSQICPPETSDKSCSKCDLKSIFPPWLGEDRMLPSSYTRVINGGGCVENDIVCAVQNSSVCDMYMNLLYFYVEYDDDGSTEFAFSLNFGVSEIKGTTYCGESGKYEVSGQKFDSMYCSIANCRDP